MTRTILPQPLGLYDYQKHVERCAQTVTGLDRIARIVPWEQFRVPLDEALQRNHRVARGRPSFDVVFMFKVIILQKIHNLSDDMTELAVMDRLSWHRFLGVDVAQKFPDAKTIWLFRDRMAKSGVMDKLFDIFLSHIRNAGVELVSGKIVDATIISVPKQRNTRTENEQIKQGDIPADWSEDPAKLAQKDTDARWLRKNGINYFGYKNHVKVDQKTKIIEKYHVTSANVHDSQAVAHVVQATDGRLYGDSAYVGPAVAAVLKQHVVQRWVHEKGVRGTPLTPEQQAKNRNKSHIRARIEHVFGDMVMGCGGKYSRCIGMTRNVAAIGLTNLIYNMRRLVTLQVA